MVPTAPAGCLPVRQTTCVKTFDNYHTYGQLCGQLAELNIEHTLALRAAQSPAANPSESKKTPRGSRRRKN